MTDVAKPYGSNDRITPAISDIYVHVIGDREVELVASIAPDPTEQNPERQPPRSVAIHMDQSVAMKLFDRLRETFRSMGWPLPQ